MTILMLHIQKKYTFLNIITDYKQKEITKACVWTCLLHYNALDVCFQERLLHVVKDTGQVLLTVLHYQADAVKTRHISYKSSHMHIKGHSFTLTVNTCMRQCDVCRWRKYTKQQLLQPPNRKQSPRSKGNYGHNCL